MAKLSADIEEQIDRAMATARDYFDYEVASSVRYLASEDLLLLVLKSGRRFAIPIEEIQGLADADRQAVAAVELVASGSALHWEQLDVDFSAEGLSEGRTGNDRWMNGLQEKRRSNAAAALSQTA